MSKRIFLIIILILLSTKLIAEQIILFEIEKTHNFQLTEHIFKVSETNFFEKSNEYFYAIVPYRTSLEESINIIINKYGIKLNSISLLRDNIINENIILKKYLIIEKKYDIIQKNGKKFYKFKIYRDNFKITTSKNFIQDLIEQFKIEYGIN